NSLNSASQLTLRKRSMSKFKDEIAKKLFRHLDDNLSYEVKSILTSTLVAEVVHHSSDFIELQRLNDIFDSAIKLQEALIQAQRKKDSEECEDTFMGELKNL